jgi:hypothetical protein
MSAGADHADASAGGPAALEPIAWVALVARWVEVARASRAIPAADARLRDSIAPLIAIEANTAALGELARVPDRERAHARDLAEISIRAAAGQLDALWRGAEWPDELHSACSAAERALRHALYAGLEEYVVAGDAPLEVPEWSLSPGLAWTRAEDVSPDALPLHGTLAAMQPGTIALPGEPVAWWCGRDAPACPDPQLAAQLMRRAAVEPLQVYRSLDDRGHFVADRIASIEDDVSAGLPLLTPLLLDGHRVGRFLQPRDTWLALQRAALGGRTSLPIHR